MENKLLVVKIAKTLNFAFMVCVLGKIDNYNLIELFGIHKGMLIG